MDGLGVRVRVRVNNVTAMLGLTPLLNKFVNSAIFDSI
jgi:hypothetical protein